MSSQGGVALVITTIAAPNQVMKRLARGCRDAGWDFILIGDVSSPAGFVLDRGRFFDLKSQRKLGLNLAEACPTRHYARKNIGYLLAMREGRGVIIDTDDDNMPGRGFWEVLPETIKARTLTGHGWVNVYQFFSKEKIWPRGFPLRFVGCSPPRWSGLPFKKLCCPIQQSLSDDNPDVDAIYRLVMPLPLVFRWDRGKVVLGQESFCPFNSQNTIWHRRAFPLMYLPSFCSFRMTDIWRGFIAQRIAQENGWGILFRSPTNAQKRNPHDLMNDFKQEVPGYLDNERIMQILHKVRLYKGELKLLDCLKKCYDALIVAGIIDERESLTLDAWCRDVRDCRRSQ